MSEKASGPRVTITENGPYVVTGDIPLSEQIISTNAAGESETWTEKSLPSPGAQYALCRCGRSGSKPFCDGSHAKVGFDGTEVADRSPYLDRAKAFDGPEDVALLDVESLCAFARYCDPHGQVWSEVGKIDGPKTRTTFIHQVERCPSGRLVVWDKRRQAPLEPDLPQSIGLIEDPAQHCSGPLWLRGRITLVSSDGTAYEASNRMTVCRCGQSHNKPFCDGTHAAIKFTDEK